MTFPSWGSSQPPSQHPPGYPPSSSDEPHLLNGNVYLMLGELVGNVRWLVRDSYRKTEQIDHIQAQLRDGSSMFKDHSARLKNLEQEKVSRIERLSKRWAAFLLPPLTVVLTYWLTGNLDAAIKLAERLPK